jgi:hypothetical protein
VKYWVTLAPDWVSVRLEADATDGTLRAATIATANTVRLNPICMGSSVL